MTKPILLRFEHYAWPQAASVALDLKRRGADVYTTPWWNFMFGKRHDETRLGPEPESQAVVWWVTVPAADQGHVLSPELSLFTAPAPIEPAGAEIHFSEKANGYRYVVSGLTAGNVEMAWTDLPRFTILFEPRSTAHDVRLVFEAQSNVDREGEMIAQPGEVYLNGQALGTVVVNERAAVSVVVPREVWNGKPTALLEVRFPQAKPTRTFQRPGYVNWRAWGLWAVRTEPAR